MGSSKSRVSRHCVPLVGFLNTRPNYIGWLRKGADLKAIREIEANLSPFRVWVAVGPRMALFNIIVTWHFHESEGVEGQSKPPKPIGESLRMLGFFQLSGSAGMGWGH